MTKCEGGSVPRWVISVIASVLIAYMLGSLVWDQLSQHKYPSPFTLLQVVEAVAAAALAYTGGKKLAEHREKGQGDQAENEEETK